MAKLTKDAVEQARIALSNFRALQPTLTAYARMLTGRADVVVEASGTTNGATDGKKIYYRPPISLGKRIAHQRWACDRRDSLGIMRCPACAQREDVLVTMYHEIAHIWFKSFQGVKEHDKVRAIKEAVDENGTKYGEAIKKRVREKAYLDGVGYMGLASIISPFLPILLNALEDARVNSALFKAMPGLQIMFEANTSEVFRNGVEQVGDDGEWTRQLWRDRPLNMQALVGVFCMASGYNFDEWLHEFVVHALHDEKLVELVRAIDNAASVEMVFHQSFPILARLRELGFCRNEEDPEDDFVPPYEEESDDTDDAGSDDGGTGSDDGGESEETESADEATGGGSDPEGSDDSSGGDESGEGDSGDKGGPSEGEEVSEESGGAASDGSESGSGGSSPSDEESSDAPGGARVGGDLDKASNDGDDTDGADHSLGEADRGSSSDSDAESGGESDDGDPSGVRDGDGGGVDELDGLPGEDSGVPDKSEPGDLAESDADTEGGESDPGVVDTGEFTKGTRVEDEAPRKPRLPWGGPDDVEIVVMELGDHEPPTSMKGSGDHSHGGSAHTHGPSDEDEKGDAAVKAVIVQGVWFEMPSARIGTVQIYREGDEFFHRHDRSSLSGKISWGITPDPEKLPNGFDPDESIIGPSVLRGRVVFAANQRGKHERNQKRGRVHGASLGRKAPFNDPRLFEKKTLPGRVDYFVGLGVDISGSTMGVNMSLAKQVVLAEAEMLDRLGVPFFLYAHSGGHTTSSHDYDLHMFVCKDPHEPWNERTKNRVRNLAPDHANLDGHTMEFYRKMLEQQRATKKIMHYYSDGAMPAENRNEELAILRREIQKFKQLGMILSAVGIRTDAPRQHGLETVRVDKPEDVIKVVNDLEKRLLKR